MNIIKITCISFVKIFLGVLFMLFTFNQNLKAQNVGIADAPFIPDPHSMLEVQSNSKGILIPRMTDAERMAINPTWADDFGLLVYQTNTVSIDNAAGYWYWNGYNWVSIGNGHNWSIDGNAGTNPNINFIGTTDANDLVFRTNNTERARIHSTGNFGIGTVSPTTFLHVEGDGTTLPIVHVHSTTDQACSISLTAPVKSYRIGQNLPPDHPGYYDGFYIYDETENTTRLYVTTYGEVGIGTVDPSQKLSVAGGISIDHNDANTGNLTNALVFGGPTSLAGIASKRNAGGNQNGLDFYTGSANRMAITSTGNVGIGTTSPNSKLDVQNWSASTGATITNSSGSNTTDALQAINYGTGNGIYSYASGINAAGIVSIQGNVWPNLAWYNNGAVPQTANLGSGKGIYTGGKSIGIEACAMEDGNTTTDQLGGVFYVRDGGSGIPAVASVGSVVDNVVYKIIGFGAVSTIVNDEDQKPVIMAAPEAPEVLFQDFGTGQLTNGMVHITIDPILAKNITVDEKHPVKIFIQLNDECNGVYVANKNENGFDVIELKKGSSNAKFSWMLTANRKNETRGSVTSDYENFRFKRTECPAFTGVAANH